MTQLAIVGTGAWGTALAIHGANAGHDVALLGRRPDVVERLRATRAHPALPGAPPIPAGSSIDGRSARRPSRAPPPSSGPSPSRRRRAELERLNAALPAVPLVATSKGIEIGTRRRTTEIMSFVTGRTTASRRFRARPSRRRSRAALPAAAVVASRGPRVSRFLQGLLSSPTLRLYRSSDVLGVEIAGAAKNVIAIAAGIVDGLKLGHNTRAARSRALSRRSAGSARSSAGRPRRSRVSRASATSS